MSIQPFLVVGAGAVGTYIGGSLALHGYPVVWLVRPQHVDTLRHRGLRLVLPHGTYHLPARPLVTTWEEALHRHPSIQGIILALKAYHLNETFLGHLSRLRDHLPPILSLLNGVGGEEPLIQILGPERVVLGTLLTAVQRDAIGAIRVTKFRGMGLDAGHPLSSHWARIFEASRLEPRLYANPQAMKWSKLLTNLIANSLSALLDWPPGRIYRHPKLCRIEMAQQREALAVMKALGLPVVNLPKTPVRALAWIVEHLPSTWACAMLRPLVAGGRGDKMPSFHRDLHEGTGRTEAAWYHGPVVRYGRKTGISTPVHQTLLDLWQAIERGDTDPSVFHHRPQALLAYFQEQGVEV